MTVNNKTCENNVGDQHFSISPFLAFFSAYSRMNLSLKNYLNCLQIPSLWTDLGSGRKIPHKSAGPITSHGRLKKKKKRNKQLKKTDKFAFVMRIYMMLYITDCIPNHF